MELQSVVEAAIPGASAELCDHVLWTRTSFPAGAVSAPDVYKAASRMRRAQVNGLRLCEWCDRIASEGRWTCVGCQQALAKAVSGSSRGGD